MAKFKHVKKTLEREIEVAERAMNDDSRTPLRSFLHDFGVISVCLFVSVIFASTVEGQSLWYLLGGTWLFGGWTMYFLIDRPKLRNARKEIDDEAKAADHLNSDG